MSKLKRFGIYLTGAASSLIVVSMFPDLIGASFENGDDLKLWSVCIAFLGAGIVAMDWRMNRSSSDA